MNWFRENRFLGTFLLVAGVLTLAALAFLFTARSGWNDAAAQFETNANELGRLQRLAPFPSGENLRKMKAHAQDYDSAVAKLKADLKTRVLPAVPVAPSEFQSRLRIAIGAVSDKARANKVKLPEPFFLGFDEFASALPDTAAAPVLAQELAQVELLLNIMIDARVDAITSLRRVTAAERTAASVAPSATPSRAGAQKSAAENIVQRGVIETAFIASPAAGRRVLNQIGANDKQLYIVRLLHVRNEKGKGPPREAPAESAAAPAGQDQAQAKPAGALHFIVGTEHVEMAARVEMLRFNF